MVSRLLLDLRHYRLAEAAKNRVAWRPTAAVYCIRIVLVLLFWLLLGIVWLFTVETPWDWQVRRDREELRRQKHNVAVERAFRGLAESGISIDAELNPAAKIKPSETQWRLRVPAWLKSITFLSLVFGFYWAVCTYWNRIVLWRDERNTFWIRFWYLWPRKRKVGDVGSARLIVRAMQIHHFFKRLHTGTRWYWILQITSELVPSLPTNPSTVGLTWKAGIPDLLVADQSNSVSHDDSPPREIQIWIANIQDALGIQSERLRIIPQELEWTKSGRPIRISRESLEVHIPTTQSETHVDFRDVDPEQIQKMLEFFPPEQREILRKSIRQSGNQ